MMIKKTKCKTETFAFGHQVHCRHHNHHWGINFREYSTCHGSQIFCFLLFLHHLNQNFLFLFFIILLHFQSYDMPDDMNFFPVEFVFYLILFKKRAKTIWIEKFHHHNWWTFHFIIVLDNFDSGKIKIIQH